MERKSRQKTLLPPSLFSSGKWERLRGGSCHKSFRFTVSGIWRRLFESFTLFSWCLCEVFWYFEFMSLCCEVAEELVDQMVASFTTWCLTPHKTCSWILGRLKKKNLFTQLYTMNRIDSFFLTTSSKLATCIIQERISKSGAVRSPGAADETNKQRCARSSLACQVCQHYQTSVRFRDFLNWIWHGIHLHRCMFWSARRIGGFIWSKLGTMALVLNIWMQVRRGRQLFCQKREEENKQQQAVANTSCCKFFLFLDQRWAPPVAQFVRNKNVCSECENTWTEV